MHREADGFVGEISLQFVQGERDTEEGREHMQFVQIGSEGMYRLMQSTY